MTTTVSLVNIHHLTRLHKFFPLGMKTFKIYSFNNFRVYNPVLLTMVTMLYVTPPELIYLSTGSLYFDAISSAPLCKFLKGGEDIPHPSPV